MVSNLIHDFVHASIIDISVLCQVIFVIFSKLYIGGIESNVVTSNSNNFL